jgi:hypothetical protein
MVETNAPPASEPTAPGKETKRVTKKNLWDDSTVIPPWMKRYFAWHESERKKLTRENWQSRRYLVVRCLADDSKCGGTSDRLTSLPYLIMLANRTNRLLFIYWSRPAALEEFLVPPAGGMNWTVPEAVTLRLGGVNNIQVGRADAVPYMVSEPANAHWAETDRVVVEARPRGMHGAVGRESPMERYDASRDSPPEEAIFEQVYGDMWRVLFEPSPPVAARIESTLQSLGLKARGEYVSAHVRAQYMEDATGDTEAVQNAVRCAASLHPGAPVYLASDSNDVARFGLEYGRRSLQGREIVAVIRDQPPLHIDRGSNFLSLKGMDWNRHPPSAYYDTFVDLYLLSNGICITTGIGNYGNWATMISRNASCSIKHNNVTCQ